VVHAELMPDGISGLAVDVDEAAEDEDDWAPATATTARKETAERDFIVRTGKEQGVDWLFYVGRRWSRTTR